MEKKKLQEILSQPFVLNDWRQVLIEIFGVKNFFQNPSEIILPKNNKAKAAYELGSFNTSDDRIIGLYLVKVNPDVWIEKNKVGLRELLRNVYKYDVDGALVVFEQDNKWRLSFISEIRTFDDEGNIVKQATEPKRYTYLLGEGEKTKTPVDRIFSIAEKKLHLEDIRNAFSVEALNEEFYKIVARHFYQLVGATEGKGAKSIRYESILQLPIGKPSDNATNNIYQEFSVRLIGRTVFCWFLKVKKSDAGFSLLPEHLLSSKAVKENKNYYHSILENLFFQTLNTPMNERINGLPQGTEQIPFLNGGLFEPQPEDYYKLNKTTGFSEYLNTVKIPDEWFISFFEYLEQYNFTIDENSVVDIEVSVDPEMLGRIFENLLAEIDPESGDTARKATGSFYTPREIVDYMATESIVHYLFNKTQIDKELLKPIFKIDNEVAFDKTDTENILDALDRLKILDPACGSGAFPMGVLQKIVMALQKLDKNADWWKTRQINRIENALLRKQVKEKLEQTTVEYARKIGVIQNTLYGVDIQPIAAEISKLRCFLTLIVDENIDETKPNRGVEPLPNLEFKFVTADTLLKLPEENDFGGLFNSNDDLEQLKQIRLDYLQSYGKQKIDLKSEFNKIQNIIAKQQIKVGTTDVKSRAYLISTWNPFNNEKIDWFDTLWMFGVSAFDIVIGNPPFGAFFSQSIKNYLNKEYPLLKGQPESYEYFLFLALNRFTNEYGITSLIIPTNFIESKRAEGLRNDILTKGQILVISNFRFNVWKNNAAETLIFIHQKKTSGFTKVLHPISMTDFLNETNVELLKQEKWHNSLGKRFIIRSNSTLIDKINNNTINLGKIADISQGIIVYKTREDSSLNLYIKSEISTNGNWVRLLDSKSSIQPYKINWGGNYLNYGNWLWCPRDEKYFNQPKILFIRLRNKSLSRKLIGAFDDMKYYNRDNFNNIIQKDKSLSLKYILALFNSSLINYWYKTHFDNVNINPEQVRMIPIKKVLIEVQNVFIILVDYINFIKNLNDTELIIKQIPNDYIVQLFVELIDACVYELYFEDDFKKANIEFIKYAQRDLLSIEGKTDKEIKETIHSIYQKLNVKDNEIRQNLKLIDTRLSSLISPIKTAN